MQPLAVVNNHGQFNHLILRSLRDMGLSVEMVSNTTAPADLCRYRGIILGGGPAMDRAGRCREYVDLGIPVLGICLGLQVIALARGGSVEPGSMGGYGMVEVEVLSENGILAGYPDRIQVWASHMDEVREVPPGYSVLARSRIARVEAIASEEEKIYGVQWHPEVSHTVNGRLVFQNFDRLCQEGGER
ncbi:MAG: GMP synthase subunit A [Methanomicrobiales archaeon]|nr:GMP synthase subunit A [Methanomicrobiales archaeon]MDD1657484.1 GMP synthase subunit A [Methanomicrobiales archaeon]